MFRKKGVLRCVFDWEFEVFWIVKRRGSLIKLGALLKICLFAWDIDVFWIIIGGQSQGTLGNYCRYSGKDLHIIQG